MLYQSVKWNIIMRYYEKIKLIWWCYWKIVVEMVRKKCLSKDSKIHLHKFISIWTKKNEKKNCMKESKVDENEK